MDGFSNLGGVARATVDHVIVTFTYCNTFRLDRRGYYNWKLTVFLLCTTESNITTLI
jgi:hypothetical protein